MPNDASSTVFSCPRCSAAVAMEGDRGACSYCGTPIERPGIASRLRAASDPWSASAAGYPRAVEIRPRRGVRPLLALLLALATAAGGFVAGRASTGPSPGAIVVLPTGAAQATPARPAAELAAGDGTLTELLAALPRDGAGADLLVYMYHSDSSRYSLALIDGGSHALRWRSPLLSREAYQGALALGGDFVFLTDHDQLLALRRRDGTLAWQATLAVEPANSCDGCLRALGKQVAVLQKDGTVAVFGAESGQPAWSTRLASRPNELVVAGDRLVTTVVGEGEQPTRIEFLDPASGKPVLQLEPVCPRAHDTFHDERPDASSAMLFSPDGSAMYLMFGFFARCAQSWDVASGTLRWQTPLGDDAPLPNWRYEPPVAGDGALFTGYNNRLWALGTADGTVRTLATEKEYNLAPLALRDGILVVLAAPIWDSQRQELWGLDAQTGERRWQQKLQAHQLRRGTSSGDWEARLTPQGLLVAQVLRDDAQLLIETFDLGTGKSLARKQHALDGMHMPSLRASLWADDTAWFMLDSEVFAVDLASGAISYRLS